MVALRPQADIQTTIELHVTSILTTAEAAVAHFHELLGFPL